MRPITKQAICTILAVLFALTGILPVSAEEISQTPEEPPAFTAQVAWSGGNGYIVMGTFTEFTSGITNIQPLYSADGQSYLPCEDMDWDLRYNPEDAGELQKDGRQFTECDIDCPVVWKSLSFASLTHSG